MKRKWQVFLPDATTPSVRVKAKSAEKAAEKALARWRENKQWDDYFFHNGLRIAVKEVIEHKVFGDLPSSLEVFKVNGR